MAHRTRWLLVVALTAPACAASGPGDPGGRLSGDDAGAPPTFTDAGPGAPPAPPDPPPSDPPPGDPPARDAGADASCEVPDVMIVLDRSLSMHRRPDGTIPPDTEAGWASSKWYTAVGVIGDLAARLGDTVRLGLTLFPGDPGGGACITVSDRITERRAATNPRCVSADVAVTPDPAAGASVVDALDAALLCRTTPVGIAMTTAGDALSAVREAGRPQHVVLITDGIDSCGGDTEGIIQDLASAGVRTHVVAFDGSGHGGVDNATLNRFACAGQTAEGFPAPCVDDGTGAFTARDPDGPTLFTLAEDGVELETGLVRVAGQLCCNCLM